jgi:YgiT-type zinc finger domain-containing protein
MAKKQIDHQALLDAINRAYDDSPDQEELIIARSMRVKQRRLMGEHLVEQRVTYTLEMNGKLFVVENVPARVNPETGEQFFSPDTVERLHEIIRGQEKPVRVVETPVFDYAA